MKKNVRVVSFDEVVEQSRDHPGVVEDGRRRELNVQAGKDLCPRCEGTGNQLYLMYQRCTECDGYGFITDDDAN